MQTAKEVPVENFQSEVRRGKKLEDGEKLIRNYVTHKITNICVICYSLENGIKSREKMAKFFSNQKYKPIIQ